MPHRLTDLHARLPPPGTLRAGLHGLDTRVFELAAGTLSLWYMIALIGPGQHNGPVPGPLRAAYGDPAQGLSQRKTDLAAVQAALPAGVRAAFARLLGAP